MLTKGVDLVGAEFVGAEKALWSSGWREKEKEKEKEEFIMAACQDSGEVVFGGLRGGRR